MLRYLAQMTKDISLRETNTFVTRPEEAWISTIRKPSETIGKTWRLFEDSRFETETCLYCTAKIVNRKRELTMHRVWIHAKFIASN